MAFGGGLGRNVGARVEEARANPAQAAVRVPAATLTGGVSEYYKMEQDKSKKKAKNAAAAEEAARQQQYQEREGTLGAMNKMSDEAYEAQQGRYGGFKKFREEADRTADLADDTYSNSIQAAEGELRSQVEQLQNQARDQAEKANSIYTNNIQPSYKNAMEKADQNAAQAMSLNEAGDMNNKIQQGVRDFFNKQAANEGRAGVADVGVLQSLGAQANAQQMGTGAPMTGAQMQLMQAQNAQQAGQAFANVQRRQQGLRQQGIEQGMLQSNAQYERGQAAQEAAARRREGFMGAQGQYEDRTRTQRGEQMGYGERTLGSKKSSAGAAYNQAMSKYGRGLDRTGQFYNMETGLGNQRLSDLQTRAMAAEDIKLGNLSDERMKAYGQMQAANAQIAARNQMLGSGIQAVGTGAGAYFGGAQGAQAGNAMGGAVGGGVAGQMNAQQQNNQQQPPPGYYQQRQYQGSGGYG